MTEELKPCPNPWCNSQRADRPEPYVYYYESGCYYRVRCDVCPQIGPSGDTKAEAITAWNTRLSHSAGQQALIEALEKIAASETKWGNATVRRMAEIARSTLLSMRNNGND